MCKKLQLLGDFVPRLPVDHTVGLPIPHPIAALSGNESLCLLYGCVLVTTSAARHTPGGPGIRGMDSRLDDTDKILVTVCLYCLNCTKFGQLIVRKTRCQILRLKCTKVDFGWGSAPYNSAGGAYSAPPGPRPPNWI